MPRMGTFRLGLTRNTGAHNKRIRNRGMARRVTEVQLMRINGAVGDPGHFCRFRSTPSVFSFVRRLQDVNKGPIKVGVIMKSLSTLRDVVSCVGRDNGNPSFVAISNNRNKAKTACRRLTSDIKLPVRSTLAIISRVLERCKIESHIGVVTSNGLVAPSGVTVTLTVKTSLIGVTENFVVDINYVVTRIYRAGRYPTKITAASGGLRSKLVISRGRCQIYGCIVSLERKLFGLTTTTKVSGPARFREGRVIRGSGFNEISPVRSVLRTTGHTRLRGRV